MSRLSIAGLAVLGTLAVALVLGTQYLNGDPNSSTVVTVLGLLGLGISQLLGNKETQEAKDMAEETKTVTEELSKDLRNGTFKRLFRESLTELADEKGFPLEIQKGKESETDGR